MTTTRVTIDIPTDEDEDGDGDGAAGAELLRGLAADLNQDEDLSGFVHPVRSPPTPGEQGGAVTAIEVLNAVGPYVSPLIAGIFGWLAARRVRLRLRRDDGSEIEVVAATAKEAERLTRFLQAEGQGEEG